MSCIKSIWTAIQFGVRVFIKKLPPYFLSVSLKLTNPRPSSFETFQDSRIIYSDLIAGVLLYQDCLKTHSSITVIIRVDYFLSCQMFF